MNSKALRRRIRRDYAAVRAAFTSEWSNGQVEAQVNCLKREIRIVFGRANFDLTRTTCPLPGVAAPLNLDGTLALGWLC